MIIMRPIAIFKLYEFAGQVMNIVHVLPCAPRVFTRERGPQGREACVRGTLNALT
jgi:hypothetical protein